MLRRRFGRTIAARHLGSGAAWSGSGRGAPISGVLSRALVALHVGADVEASLFCALCWARVSPRRSTRRGGGRSDGRCAGGTCTRWALLRLATPHRAAVAVPDGFAVGAEDIVGGRAGIRICSRGGDRAIACAARLAMRVSSRFSHALNLTTNSHPPHKAHTALLLINQETGGDVESIQTLG